VVLVGPAARAGAGGGTGWSVEVKVTGGSYSYTARGALRHPASSITSANPTSAHPVIHHLLAARA